ncbi:hypothetical protein ATPR_2426 [Acetobacter tropicalis NBRC 101654]|uniref:Uncharacterized protein n=1 Tax=Acetobacter tropicalis NBRC 101654 TaxID=749388 RepID=F7VGC7_9PROT|nr:hypothetical protein ATPR_2426 [Acetobacter tropicalis NBRC 101654]
MLCRLLGHKWSAWQRQRSWDGSHDFLFRHCTRQGCLATEKKAADSP